MMTKDTISTVSFSGYGENLTEHTNLHMEKETWVVGIRDPDTGYMHRFVIVATDWDAAWQEANEKFQAGQREEPDDEA